MVDSSSTTADLKVESCGPRFGSRDSTEQNVPSSHQPSSTAREAWDKLLLVTMVGTVIPCHGSCESLQSSSSHLDHSILYNRANPQCDSENASSLSNKLSFKRLTTVDVSFGC